MKTTVSLLCCPKLQYVNVSGETELTGTLKYVAIIR